MTSADLFTIDWSKVPQEIADALASGKARIIDGVARDSKSYEILKHIPFRTVTLSQTGDLAQVAHQVQSLTNVVQQSTAVLQTAIALSTAVTVGAVVLSTAYLASKLRELESKIERLEGELRGQNLLFYASKASSYFAAVEATRELIASPELVAENRDLIAHSLSRLAGQRHETMAFLGNLCRLFDHLSPAHQALALDFFHATLDFVPKAVLVESQAAYRLERFRLGDHLRQSARTAYDACLTDYKAWANALLKNVTRAAPGTGDASALIARLGEAKRLIACEQNQILLGTSI
ncbi:MAG: hypothetical protein ABJF10_13630 [Chthoniobacter sp.]|uniref:hypothetical protein n=1 Tax=Chthoniobacter sp. TaxID=2510640 RepID=UPI0032A677CA